MDISDEVMARVRTWLSYEYDPDTRERVQYLLDNDPQTLQESFRGELEFGTGGIRELMGVGTHRLNIYTVARATQGLALYLCECYPHAPEIRVAIAFDSRNNSSRFAEITAETLAANGIRVFLYESLRPTPQLSFTVRALACHAGVVITASHNPKEYNGYKVYWSDGGQVVSPHDKGIINAIRRVDAAIEIKRKGDSANIFRLGAELDEVYLSTLLSHPISNYSLSSEALEIGIVYTPIHGTGGTLISQLLRRRGFKNVHLVAKQRDPDGNFPTVTSPNPEDPSAMALAVSLAEETAADLVLGTDPDSDRIGVYARDTDGTLRRFDGNQIAILLAYYVLEREKALGLTKGKRFMVRTIVTTPLLDSLAEAYHVDMLHVLTGFKYIAAAITAKERSCRFVMGAEESHGYLVGCKVRDKDAIQSALYIAEFAAWCKSQKTTLGALLYKIYAQYGYWQHAQRSLIRKGETGRAEIQERMEALRTTPPQTIGGEAIVRITDYLRGTQEDPRTNTSLGKVALRADVIEFETETNSRIIVRPSGTEPKIKYYVGVRANSYSPANEQALEARLNTLLNALTE